VRLFRQTVKLDRGSSVSLSLSALRIKLIRQVDAARRVTRDVVAGERRGEDQHAMTKGYLALLIRRDGNPIDNGSIRGDK